MNQSQNTGKLYHCPMHPEIRQPNSGKCPKCGMDLLPGLRQQAVAEPQ
jgi:Cu(I)/Ag(I) efflux system membrane fusion protein